ncbi:PREDICTED: F-box only protein 31-like [Myotis brandtii]|uniref:F-box only protein 31-like n=1 Tax=Myotis brandtii TaxID=109478 RepID=UPI0003BB926A|nr:PREDICTED: F-box only protein 31-like [Myotis brandtii]
MAAAEGTPALAEKHLEEDAAVRCCAGSGGIVSPMPPLRYSLQDLPPELLVKIFALLPGTDLPCLAQACTKFHHILHIDSIWRRRCREEYGVRETLQNLETIGMSYREVYAKLFHPYRNILGLWQPDDDYRRLLYVAVDGLCITGWMNRPCLNTNVDDPMQFKPSFRIRLTERKSATLEYMDDFYSFSHSCHMQIRKDRFSIQWIKRDHRTDLQARLRGEWGRVLVREDRQQYDCLTYRRLYLPPHHPDDLIRPGLFHSKYDGFCRKIAMLSFHGKYARVREIRGDLIWTLEIHLMRHIHLRDGEFFRNFNELSCVVQEIKKQVIREQQQVCFYAVDTVTLTGLAYRGRFPGVFILFDENHLGFIWQELKYFILFGSHPVQSSEHLPECGGTIWAGLPGHALEHSVHQTVRSSLHAL